MAHLSLGVLGSLQVLLDDTPVTTLESDKVCALLVYLAVEADYPHLRESLVGLLWPDCPERVARHNLRQALFNLRLAIGDHSASPSYLLISREAIQFNRASDFSLDLAQFNTLVQACRKDRSRDIEDPSLRAARLEEMVKLYRGEFLQHFFLEDSAEFEQWTLVQRESSHQHVLDACSYLADYYELHGDFQAARRHASRQLELDSWREEAHCQMMRALALDGQRSAALAQYETCRRVLAKELDVEPSASTRELYERIRAGELRAKDESPSSVPSAPIHNLPVSLTSFHGREQELVDLERLIANPECRCISLVGPGGIGKTRLALETAQRHRADFAHGVAFVPLASVGSVEAAVIAIASAIHFHFYGLNEPQVQLLSHLCEKHMLLILDTVEQLLTQGSLQVNFVEFMLEILQRASGVNLLVTAREVLDLQEEWVFEVRGLEFPERKLTEKLDEYAAVELFIQRARRASPGFAFSETDLAGIAHICRLVEGMPLAIELAATWLRILSPVEIAQEIEGSLDFLSSSVRDIPERHRSMRVVFDHSWRTLSPKEQQVLSQLSVFRGGFSRQAAEQVAGASLAVLSALGNRALLRRAAAGRYGLHELLRQYCTTHLVADPEAHAAAQKRHYDYFLEMAAAAEQELKGRDQLEWLRRLEQDHDNLRAALEWALEHDGMAQGDDEWALRLSGALHLFWRMRGHFHEGRSWLAKSLGQCLERHSAAMAAALFAKGSLLYALGDVSAGRLLRRKARPFTGNWAMSMALPRCLRSLGSRWSGKKKRAWPRLGWRRHWRCAAQEGTDGRRPTHCTFWGTFWRTAPAMRPGRPCSKKAPRSWRIWGKSTFLPVDWFRWESLTWVLGSTCELAHALSMAWLYPVRSDTRWEWRMRSPILAAFTGFWASTRPLRPTLKSLYRCMKSEGAVVGRPTCCAPWPKTLSLKETWPRRDSASKQRAVAWAHPRTNGSRRWCVTFGACWRITKGIAWQL